MTEKAAKKYVPTTYTEAEAIINTMLPAAVVQEMCPGEIVTYVEILKLHSRIDEIENQANDMMSPDKMMELASSFLGNGLG